MYYKNIKMYLKPAKSTGQKVVGDKNLFPKAVVFILVFLSFLIFSFFVKTSDAKAAASSGACNMYVATGPANALVWPKYPLPIGDAKDAAACKKMCPPGAHIRCEFVGGTTPGAELAKSVNKQKKDEIQKAIDSTQGGCSLWNLDICLLKPVMWMAKLLLLMAASLFGWILDVKNFHYVVNNNGAIQQAWTLIRDILNMVFILVLLFSAFCTIFQVSKYNYKKILLTLVIMALLVNFSFPISRIIIDASNVMMYSIIKTQIPSTSNFVLQVTQNAQIGVLLDSNSYKTGGMMLVGIVFIFILSITLLAVAILFVIRMIALAILIIFSPIGFVGHIMPGFEKYANQWWDNLFRYAFFGPIMMLGLYVAIQIMTATISVDTVAVMIDGAKKNSSSMDAGIVGAMAFSFIPVVILWMTMGLAQSMSIAGASTVMGGAQKLIKGAGKKFSMYNWGKKRVDAFRTERKRREDEKFKFNIGKKFGNAINKTQDTILGRLGSRRASRRVENLHNADVREHMKEIDNVTNEDELANLYANARSAAQREAVLRRAASIGGTGRILTRNGQAANREGLVNFMTTEFGDNDRSSRVASEITHLEATKNNHQYGGSSTYDVGTNRHVFNGGAAATYAPGTPVRTTVFNAAGGAHPQLVARNLKAGFVTTFNPGGAPNTHNEDFENFLQDMGTDFDTSFTNASGSNQLNQVPAAVIRQLQAMRTAGIHPPAGSRTETLIDELVTLGRII